MSERTLVERLRSAKSESEAWDEPCGKSSKFHDLEEDDIQEAADEIERLQKERVNLLGRIRRIACNHKGIGLPGCTVCDPKWEQHIDIALGISI